jgi:L-asparaginase
MGNPLQKPAGSLRGSDIVDGDHPYIPEVTMYAGEGGRGERKRILILCTGGTLTMAPDPKQGGALAPVQGAISNYMKDMPELTNPGMPDYVLHEVSCTVLASCTSPTSPSYPPVYSTIHFEIPATLGLQTGVTIAADVRANYLHFDGFVVLTGTDTMAYCATALSFMLENLGNDYWRSRVMVME